jgi:hypothetical protein
MYSPPREVTCEPGIAQPDVQAKFLPDLTLACGQRRLRLLHNAAWHSHGGL